MLYAPEKMLSIEAEADVMFCLGFNKVEFV